MYRYLLVLPEYFVTIQSIPSLETNSLERGNERHTIQSDFTGLHELKYILLFFIRDDCSKPIG